MNYGIKYGATPQTPPKRDGKCEDVTALTRLIEEGQERSYEEWKRGVKRKASVCIAEYLVKCGVKVGGGE